MSRNKSRLIIGAIAATMVLGNVGAATAATSETAGPAVVVDGRLFTATDGLTVQSGSVLLNRSSRAARTFGKTTFTRGSSYASTEEKFQLAYEGKARAMANIYNGQRVIQAKFKYSRTSDVISWQTSNASSGSSCYWTAGSAKSKTVWDDLNPSAPKTRFHYDFSLINRQVC